MGVAFFILAWFGLMVFLLGLKLLVIFGRVVAIATFLFPFGLIGLVALGVALLFLLTPKQRTD